LVRQFYRFAPAQSNLAGSTLTAKPDRVHLDVYTCTGVKSSGVALLLTSSSHR
jgi:hypothetical protein